MNTTLAYLSGYTDGDGCFHIRQLSVNKFQATFIISSTSKPVLDFFLDEFGGKLRFVRQIRKQKPQYHYVKRGNDAYELVKQIYEFLIEKKREAQAFIKFLESNDKQEKRLLIKEIKKRRLEGLAKIRDKKEIQEISLSVVPNELDFAYLAGFIDAECSIGLQRYKRPNKSNWIYKAILQCNNTRSQTLKWAMSRFGGQIHFIHRKKYGIHHKNQLTWRLSSKSFSNLLPKIHPFLQTKKPVCEQLMKFSKTIINLEKTPGRNSPKFKEFCLPIYQEREIIFDTIRHLNRKGI